MPLRTFFYFFFLIFLLSPIQKVKGNKADSLEQALVHANDSMQVKILHAIIRNLEYSNPKKALTFAYRVAKHPITQNSGQLSRNYIEIGKLYKNLGQYDSAVSNMLHGIRIAETAPDHKAMAIGYNSLGVIFKLNKDWIEALKYYQLAYKECALQNYPTGIGMTLSNIGTIHDALGQTDSAIYYYNRATEIGEKHNLISVKAVAYNNIGEVLAKQKKYSEAIPYFYKTLACDSITGNKLGMAYTLMNIASSYEHEGSIDRSFEVFKQLEQVSDDLKSSQIYSLYYFQLARLYELSNQPKKALEAYKHYHHLNDSVFNAEKSQQMIDMKTKYQTEKKELEIQNLSKENEIQNLEIKQKNSVLLTSAIGLIVLLILGYLSFKQYKTKQQHKMTIAILDERDKGTAAMIKGVEKERKRIAQDLHDGIGQQLSGLKLSMSHLKSNIVDEQKENSDTAVAAFDLLIDKLDHACIEVRNISHEMMPRTLIENGVLSALEDMLEKTLTGTGIDYKLEHYRFDKRLDESIELSLYRICQELINNTIKHAKANTITVQLTRSSKNVVLIVEDNGQGFDRNTKSDGIGLLSLASRLSTMNGEVNYISSPNSGTSATVRIPIV